MMGNSMIGRFMAFKKHSDDEICDKEVIIELVDFRKDGFIEIAVDSPLPGKPRIYISMSLVQLIDMAMKENGSTSL